MSESAERIPVLIIDDDENLGQMLVEYLGRFGFEGSHFHDPAAGVKACREGSHAALVLDVMMPGMDGFEVCRRVREFSSLPIIMLTARGETADKVFGLGSGADDYMAKPFEPRELIARLEALLRRADGSLTHAETADLVLNQRTGRALRQRDDGSSEDLGLTDTEYAVLSELIKRRPEPVTRDEMFSLMRGFERDISDRSIDILISRLRSKLGDDPATPRYIRTVRLVGYAFIG